MEEGLSKFEYSYKEKKALFLMEIEHKYFSTTLPQKLFQFFNGVYFSLLYVFKDTIKRWITFLIGLTTIVIVTFTVSVMYNSILKAPMIFLKVAEDQNAEYDFQLVTKLTNTSTNVFLNTTKYTEKLLPLINPQQYLEQELNESKLKAFNFLNPNKEKLIEGISPRWMFLGTICNHEDTNLNLSATLMIMDTENEEKLNIGRFWPYRSIGKGECHVKNSLLQGVKTRPQRGEQVYISISLTSMLNTLSGSSQLTGTDSGNTTITEADFQNALINSGFSFDETYQINYTQLAEDPNLPQWQKDLYEQMGVQNVTGQQIYDSLVNDQVFSGDNNALATGNLMFECTVINSMDYNYGRFPGAIGNAVVLDSRKIMEVIGDVILQDPNMVLLLQMLGMYDTAFTLFSQNNIHEYAFQIVGMYTKRFSSYLKDQDSLRLDAAQLSDNIMNAIGIEEPVTLSLPLVPLLQLTKFLSLFLDQIFLFVVVALAALGVILIFTLLLSNVEEKTYEYGMLRALGLGQFSLIEVIFLNSLYFAIPGLIIGLSGAFIINIFVELGINYFIRIPWYNLNFLLNWVAILIAFGLGLGMPAITNYFPIKKALSKRLRDSLDISHQSFNETSVQMLKLSQLGLEPWQAIISFILVVAGFMIYYVLPLSFIFEQYPLFFGVLSSILLSMVFGMCLISWIVEPYLEHIVIFLLVWGPDRKMKSLIYKNMAAHRKRTRKTFLMFVIAVAFVVGGGVVFSLAARNVVAQYQVLVGSDIRVTSSSESNPLPYKSEIEPFLQREKEKNIIDSYTSVSFSMSKFEFLDSSKLSNLAYYPSKKCSIVSLQKNFLETTLDEYYLYTDFDRSFSYKYLFPSLKPDIVDSLYTNAGQAKLSNENDNFSPDIIFSGYNFLQPYNYTGDFDPTEKYDGYIDVIISSANKEAISANIGETPLQIRLTCTYLDPETGAEYYSAQRFIAKARAMIYKFPGFFFSSYGISSNGATLFVTFENYQKMAKRCAEAVNYPNDKVKEFDSVDNVKISDIFIKMKSGVSITSKYDFLNELRGFLNPDYSIIQDAQDVLATTQNTAQILLLFFNVTSVVAMTLCFFVLFLSFTSNVRSNSWEFGVLRSIGLSVNKLIRSYIYEALALVISGFLCGLIIGCLFAFSLTAEFNLFLEMPFYFDFPYLLVVILGILAIICAILGSYLPARILKTKQIAFVLRGLD